ncbi:MAG: hypothetical protein ACOCXA_01005 [Planctomycetota bacterium]
MNPGTAIRALLVILHIAVAILLVGGMYRHAQEREAKVAQDRELLHTDEAELSRRRTELDMQQARLEGLDQRDPYVVELIARERYDYQVPGEVRPPSLDEE